MAQDQQKQTLRLAVNVSLLEPSQSEQSPEAAVYAFDANGALVARERLKDNQQQVTLALPVGKEPEPVKILVGPHIERKDITPADLERYRARSQTVRLAPDVELRPVEFAVYPAFWKCWLLSRCTVPGRLLKRVEVEDTTLNLPVCNATIEVYEVDPFPILIGRLPSIELERIRDLVIPIPRPLPDPPPVFRPIRTPVSTNVRTLAAREAPRLDLPPELVSRVKQAAGPELKKLVIDYADWFRPIFCWYYPWFVTMHKVAEAQTDETGHFVAHFYRGCFNTDQPDLYFKAKRELSGGTEVTLYAPKPVACHTRWNYQCGTEVTLYTTHPLAQTCDPNGPVNGDGHWVLVTAIGNLPLSRIRGSSADLAATTTATNLGLNHSLADDPSFRGRPFGGLLRLRLDFSYTLRSALDVYYYRVSYRKLGQPDSELLALDQEVHRHYVKTVGGTPEVSGYSLGPDTVNGTPHLFKIPPILPPDGDQWTLMDAVEDSTNAKFPTHTLPDLDGKYELVIELFDKNGAKVNINNIGGQQIRYYVPETTDLSIPGTIDILSAHGGVVDRVHPVDGMDAFLLPLHVDNNPCTAEIEPAEIGGVGTNACGVLTYTSGGQTLTLPFTALHPNGFGTYSLNTKRGVTDIAALDDSGDALPPGTYTATALISELLSAGCTVGGFSSQLYVRAQATNGWGRLSYLDRSDHAGFALTPPEDS